MAAMNISSEDKKKIGVIVLAVGVGLIAVFLTSQYVQSQISKKEEESRQQYEKVIKPLQQEIQAVRQKLSDVERVSSQQVASLLEQQRKAPAGPAALQSSLAIKTPAGKRAITILIDSLSAVGGLISPGDSVDVIAHLNVPRDAEGPGAASKPETVTAMVFQNVQILAVGSNLATPGIYDAQQQSPNLKVTLALDPEEAGLLSFVQQNGKVQLILRPPSEIQLPILLAAGWQTLSDYVLEKQGIDLTTPRSKALVEPGAEEVQPYIQIFRGGREL